MRVIALIVCLVPAAAFAQEDEARAHYLLGKQHHDAGEYAAAIAEFQEAYRLAPAPQLWFNIAQAYRLQGDKANAVDYYRKYLDAEPEGDGAGEAKENIVNLTRELEEERRKADQSRPQPKPEPKPLPPDEPRRGGGTLRWTGIGVMALGGVALGGAVYFGLHARSLDSELSSGPYPADLQDKIDEGNASERNAIILGIAGGAAVVTGATLYFLGVRAAVAPSADRAGVVITGTF